MSRCRTGWGSSEEGAGTFLRAPPTLIAPQLVARRTWTVSWCPGRTDGALLRWPQCVDRPGDVEEEVSGRAARGLSPWLRANSGGGQHLGSQSLSSRSGSAAGGGAHVGMRRGVAATASGLTRENKKLVAAVERFQKLVEDRERTQERTQETTVKGTEEVRKRTAAALKRFRV